MNRMVVGLALVAATGAPARADDLNNFLIGPVFGIRTAGCSILLHPKIM